MHFHSLCHFLNCLPQPCPPNSHSCQQQGLLMALTILLPLSVTTIITFCASVSHWSRELISFSPSISPVCGWLTSDDSQKWVKAGVVKDYIERHRWRYMVILYRHRCTHNRCSLLTVDCKDFFSNTVTTTITVTRYFYSYDYNYN